MSFENAKFAVSVAGHDAGALYLVLGSDKGRLLVADGKYHKLDSPKRKNPKHLKPVRGQAVRVTGTDAELRGILAGLRTEIRNKRSEED